MRDVSEYCTHSVSTSSKSMKIGFFIITSLLVLLTNYNL